MTALSQSTRRKLSLLQLAQELGNVSKACRLMGYHRDTFYEVRRAFQVGGVQALVEQRRGPREPHPNRVSPEIEARILAFGLDPPTHGAQRVANQLRLESLPVSPSGVRGVWLRHDLETRLKRLLRLEQAVAQDTTLVLAEEQIRLLERHSVDFRCRHVEASQPGELLNQDTFYWGILKGVGKVYVQVVVDVFCSFAFAKVYTSKMPVTACDLLYDRVLPFYEALGVAIGAILTDNGREYCGRPDQHPFELLLAMDGIQHRTTKIRSPRTNGFVERMNRTLLDECFRVAGRTTWYLEPAEIQRDLNRFLEYYNLQRSHQGYRLGGRTPAQALQEALGLTDLPPLVLAEGEEVTDTAAQAARGLAVGRCLNVNTILVVASLLLFGSSVQRFRAAGTPVPARKPTTVIVRTGPYRFSRNPIYLAFSLLQLGIAVWVNSWWLVATLAAAIAIIHWVVVPREERYLEAKFGSAYLDYKASVRRWL